jgi:peptidoglycan/xylan/chitin deacetylase (PgdA/CDA1 family)
VARAFATGKALPDNAVMISFDDGRTDAMLFGDPLLEQAGMKATMFVISGAAERPGIYYAGWGRLRAAARSGRWDIQAHSHAAHHEQRVAGGRRLPALTSLAPGESLAQYRVRVRDDLERNSAAIQAHVGRRPVAFAYPFGAYGAERTNDPAIRQILREEVARRYVLAFHQDDQDTIPLVDPGQDRVGLRRLEVGNWSGIRLLERIAKAAADGSRAAGDLGASTTGVSPLVVKQLPPPLPPIPFVGELRQEPAPIPRPGPRAPAPGPTQAPASPPTSATVPPPAEAPPTTTTDPPTTTTNPPTTNPPTPTTTTNPSTTTTGPPCIRGNGKPCRE